MALKPLRGALAEWTPGREISVDPLHVLSTAWAAIVGADVAAHSVPLSLSGNTLTIATRSSAWSQQLQFLSTTILAGVHALPQAAGIERLSFRTGSLKRVERRAVGRAQRPRTDVRRPLDSGPAVDLADAFARLRRRVTSLQRAAAATCRACEAILSPEAAARGTCAPCEGAAERARASELQRLIYMAPWLTPLEVREIQPSVTTAEYDRARRSLLQRWWLVLERTRRSGKTTATNAERHVASSYVLLQSGLPPDRITPAVVRNLLGPELHAVLWPEGTA